MVTYEDILQAWERWHETGNKREWETLWLLTQGDVETRIKTSIRGRCVDDDDLHDMIIDATVSVMERFRAADYVDPRWITSRLALAVWTALSSLSRREHSLRCTVDAAGIAVNILQKPCQM